MKSAVVTTVAFIGLQGMAFAADHTQSAPAADGKNAFVQESGKTAVPDTHTAQTQLASRLSSGFRINNACDDDGLPCPPRG
ncbi:hypothetical protein [Pseudomonas caricapapayae]|uniref:hypothetical protein n=1 Tax=Pseudomonas caricapapayae TaxID=46678 RepID=UPI0006D644F4|nr:hypothetical protein [Pseudomonas caricapapayae]KAA8698116.1 hypothetical protein F4W67_04075 [Pseudomonas caricapapayae]